ncbi:MAG: hypothetical protein V3T05_01880 [Myxococcota bacterium]
MLEQKPERLVDRFGDEIVIGAGILTTVVALGLVYAINSASDDINVMGYYLWFIVPIGAIIVGLIAGSGYGIASWFSGLKISGVLLWIVFGLLLASYFAAQYLEFRSLDPLELEDGTALGFWTYFDIVTQSQGYAVDGKTVAETLGLWGYGLRLLEVAGLSGGGLIIPLAMMKKPYCERCRRYMRTKTLRLLPASVGDKKPKKKDVEGMAAWEESMQTAWTEGNQAATELLQAGEQGNLDRMQEILAAHPPSAGYGKLPIRITVTISTCKACHQGFTVAKRESGQANNIQIEEIGSNDVTQEVGAALG